MQCSEQFLHKVFQQGFLSSPYLQAPSSTPGCGYSQRGPLLSGHLLQIFHPFITSASMCSKNVSNCYLA